LLKLFLTDALRPSSHTFFRASSALRNPSAPVASPSTFLAKSVRLLHRNQKGKNSSKVVSQLDSSTLSVCQAVSNRFDRIAFGKLDVQIKHGGDRV
jgi:hypothetical protein